MMVVVVEEDPHGQLDRGIHMDLARRVDLSDPRFRLEIRGSSEGSSVGTSTSGRTLM
jgi:hypothetical protein